MAETKTRRRRKVLAKDYNDLIAKKKETLEKYETERTAIIVKIKETESEIKKLEKEKAIYEAQKAEEEKAQKMKEISELFADSGKSLDEIKKFLSK